MLLYLAKIFFVLLLISYSLFGTGNEYKQITDSVKVISSYNQDQWISKTDSLLKIYGRNKALPEGFEIQTLIALSHYPQLKDVNIDFIYRKAVVPLASRPHVFSTLRKKEKRRYKVVISSESLEAMEDILLKNLPFNAQIGIIGHELAHTVYYQDKNFFQVINIGIRYFSSKYRAKFERETDVKTIEYGLGWQLLEYAEYVREQTDPDSNFDMDKYYLSPDEIKEHMKKQSIYQRNE